MLAFILWAHNQTLRSILATTTAASADCLHVPGTLDDDEGFYFRGAAQVGNTSTLRHANPLTQAPIVDLSFADFMTVNNLTMTGGTYGLYVRNGSTNFWPIRSASSAIQSVVC